MTIAELSRRQIQIQFFNIYPFVFRFYPNIDYPLWASWWTTTFGVTQTRSTRRMYLTEFYRKPNVWYDRVATESDVIAQEQSWTWNNSEQYGTVHLEHDRAIYIDTFTCSRADGFTDGTDEVIYIDDIPYIPLIISAPRVNQSQDLQNFSIPAYITGSVELNNKNSRVDYLINEKLYGNSLDIFTLDMIAGITNYTRSDMTQRASLYVEKPSFTTESIGLQIQDKRQSQNISIPQDRFTIDNYPDIENKYIGKIIPMLWGTAESIPAICMNGTTTSGNVYYKLSKSFTSYGTIQIDQGNGYWINKVPLGYSPTNGYIIMASSNARDTNGKYLPCRAIGATGIAISKLSDVIIDMNERYLNYEYNDTYYNTIEWESEDDSISAGSVYIDSEILLSDAIVQIQNRANVGFRYEITTDGKRTIRVDDESRTSSGTIRNVDIFNRHILPIDPDPSTLAAEIAIGYNTNYVDKSYPNILYDTYADDIEDEYRQRPRYPKDGALETYLTSSSNAIARAEYIAERFSSVRGIVILELRGYIDIRIFDIYDIELTPAEFVDGETIEGREYFGIRKIKVIEIDPDFSTMTNTIRAVIID